MNFKYLFHKREREREHTNCRLDGGTAGEPEGAGADSARREAQHRDQPAARPPRRQTGRYQVYVVVGVHHVSIV